jgi:outer membrane protein assembly factor BamA
MVSTTAMSNGFPLPTPSPYFTAVSPIFGYDPAYGTLLGLAWFSYPTGDVEEASTERSMNFVARLGPHGSLNYNEKNSDWQGNWGYQYSAAVNNFYDYETLDNTNEIVSQSDQISLDASAHALLNLNEHWHTFVGPTVSTQKKKNITATASGYFSFGFVRDSRDNTVNSHSGSYVSQTINYQPSSLTTRTDSQSAQLKTDIRLFLPLSERSTFALKSIAETSFGDGFNSSIGGSEFLRGYLAGQYEAPTLLGTQLELRFPVWSFISAVAFTEAANLISSDSQELFSTAGLGFRFGLPPDQTMSVRWDNAVNDKGQWLSYVNFNQVF